MSRQVGSLHRSISKHTPHHPTFCFPPPQSPHDNTSSSMDSDTNSNTTVYNTISQFNNSDLVTPDEFDSSEPSPSTFSQFPFQPLPSQIKIEPPSTPSFISNVTPQYSPLTSNLSDNNSSAHMQKTHELENFITLQQQLQHPQTLPIHQLSQSVKSSNPTSPTLSSTPSSSTNHFKLTQKNFSKYVYRFSPSTYIFFHTPMTKPQIM